MCKSYVAIFSPGSTFYTHITYLYYTLLLEGLPLFFNNKNKQHCPVSQGFKRLFNDQGSNIEPFTFTLATSVLRRNVKPFIPR